MDKDLQKLEEDLAWIAHDLNKLERRIRYNKMKIAQMIAVNEYNTHKKLIDTFKKMNKKLFM
jgi:hypothetical protein